MTRSEYCLSAASTALALALIEGLLRLMPGVHARLAPQNALLTASHEEYGWKGVPHSAYHWTQEGRSSGRLNAAGWRDVEHALPKPVGTRRVLVLGDSFVEALQVPLERAFTRLLERRLAEKCPERPVEVIAMGKNGFGTGQELLVYRNEGRDYKPDDVIVVFTPVNDPIDDCRRLATADGKHPLSDNEQRKPYFRLEDGKLRMDDSFRRSKRFHAGLQPPGKNLFLLDDVLRGLLRRPPVAGASAAARRVDWSSHAHGYQLFSGSLPGAWEEAMSLTGSLLNGLTAEAHEDGARMTLALLPFDLELDPTAWGQLAANAPPELGLDVERPLRRFRAIARRGSMRFVGLREELLRAAKRTGSSPLGFGASLGTGHLNETGHEAVATALADSLGCR